MTSPVGREGVVLLRRVRNSGLGKGVTRDGGGEEGIEKPTTGEVGSMRLEMKAAPGSQNANELSRTGGADSGTGAKAGVGTGVDMVMSGTAHGKTISRCAVPSGE
jgi:hypothetical protein